MVKGDDAPRFRRRHRQTLADVIQRAVANPADVVLHGMKDGQEQMTVAGDLPPTKSGAAITRDVARAALPSTDRRAQQAIDRLSFRLRRFRPNDVQIHYIPVAGCRLSAAGSMRIAVAL